MLYKLYNLEVYNKNTLLFRKAYLTGTERNTWEFWVNNFNISILF